MTLNDAQKKRLLKLARDVINYGASQHKTLAIEVSDYDESLQAQGCSFVTLHKRDVSGELKLRGCIGALKPYLPLVQDIAQHAYAAAFEDPRFPPVTETEIPQLEIEISVLTPHSPIDCNSEEELLAQLQPEEDGLILEDGHRRATFLPSVWQSLPNKEDFVRQLKLKAGLRSDHWSENTKAFRYHSISFSED